MDRRISCKVPSRYKESDFSDVISDIIAGTEANMSNDGLTLKSNLYTSELEITRFGRKFHVIMVCAFGHIHIYIQE